jgi:hypothetical protein
MVSGLGGDETCAQMAGWQDRKMRTTVAAAREIDFCTVKTPEKEK